MILDRIEGDIAVLELDDGNYLTLPKTYLPDGVQEGDILKLMVDTDATQKKVQTVKETMHRLFRD